MPKQPKPKNDPIECLACGDVYKNGRALSAHIQQKHKMSGKEYTIQYLHGGTEPMCLACGDEVRYHSYEFKRYCKRHAKLAMRAGGASGGRAEAWNKGQTKETDARLMEYSRKYVGEGNPFYGKRHSEESIARMKNESRLNEEEFEARVKNRSQDFDCHTTYEEYESRQHQYLHMTCRTCGESCERNLQALENGTRCYTCHPISKYSKAEMEIREFIKSHIEDIEISPNDRSLISPKELDVYLPEYGLAIEHNGLYWHDAERVGKDLHMKKYAACKKQNVRLLQIFGDDWHERSAIVKSMILHRMGESPEGAYARKCTIRDMDTREQKLFFGENHLSGYAAAKIAWGLYHDGQFVAAVSMRTPLNKRRGENTIELARACSKKNMNVVGGLSRLISFAKHWAQGEGYDAIITYTDLMHGDGSGYEKIGFEYVDTTANFWYTDGTRRYNRFKFRARDGMSEKDVASENKVWRVYGAGNALFRLNLSS